MQSHDHHDFISPKWNRNLEGHRKTLNENLGLVFACIASIAAVWSGYEAHHARYEADKNGQAAIKIQKDSLNAQIEAMRLSARPFVRFKGVQYDAHGGDGLYIRLNLQSEGLTPAIHVVGRSACGADKSPEDAPSLLRQAEADGPSGSVVASEFLDSTDAAFFACVQNALDKPEDKISIRVTVAGIIDYDDFFKVHHTTTFCFTQRNLAPPTLDDFLKDDEDRGFLLPCTNFRAEMT